MDTFNLHLSGILDACHSPRALATCYATIHFFAESNWIMSATQMQMVSPLAHPAPPAAPESTKSPAFMVATWSYPFSASWRSTSLSGWPQVLVTVCMAAMCATLVKHLLDTQLHVCRDMLASTRWMCQCLFQRLQIHSFTNWLTRRSPEALGITALFGNQGRNRQALRVKSSGTVKLVPDVAFEDLDQFGYEFGP